MSDELCRSPHRDDHPRLAADGLRLCLWHRDRLERHVAELPALYDACGAALTGRGGASSAGPVSGTTEPSWAVSDAPSAARTHIRVELTSWVRIGLEEGPWTQAPRNTVPALASWVVSRTDWYAARPWADEIARTITDTWHEARTAAYPNPRSRVRLGPCPEDGCDGTLIATVRRADDLLPSTVDCTAPPADDDERHTWTADEWHALGRRISRVGYVELARRVGGTRWEGQR